jgi:hypothetical protein
MSDVKVVTYLLAHNAPLNAVVPAASVMPGVIPQGTALPAISVMHVSGVWNGEISQQGRNCRARVQATAMAASYEQLKQIMPLLRAAVPRAGGTINGVSVDCILREPDGPDFVDDDAGLYMQTQDFLVIYNE